MKWSLAALLAGNAADTATSWGQHETNPILRGRDGKFDAGSTGIKFGITGALIGAELLLSRHHPTAEKAFVVANFAVGGVMAGTAVQNYQIAH